MVAQELALLLLEQGRLVSLGLAVTCRGLKPLGGLLAPVLKPQVRAALAPIKQSKARFLATGTPGICQ
jgi:hypothetical protein